jgi:outer membrane lipoprotein-sorting protein
MGFQRIAASHVALAASIVLVSVLALTPVARADNTAPAITAFDQAFAAVNDYTCKQRVHEVKGSATQDRVYQFSFMKPHFAKTLIESGDGKGSGGVWAGGDQVSGHQGGILSGIHLKVSINDPRAVSIRGVTIPMGLLQTVVHRYATIPGTLTQINGGKIGGVPTDRLELKVADPASNDGITQQILYLSQETHWPIRQILYQGSQIVLDETITDLKTNVGLTQNDFPF